MEQCRCRQQVLKDRSSFVKGSPCLSKTESHMLPRHLRESAPSMLGWSITCRCSSRFPTGRPVCSTHPIFWPCPLSHRCQMRRHSRASPSTMAWSAGWTAKSISPPKPYTRAATNTMAGNFRSRSSLRPFGAFAKHRENSARVCLDMLP